MLPAQLRKPSQGGGAGADSWESPGAHRGAGAGEALR